jgi:hypothetical protein
VDSIKHIDYILDIAFAHGKLKESSGFFAQHQGLIMTGMSAYLAEVILRNTSNATLQIDEHDESWYINFKVVGENGWVIQPGRRIAKRAFQGKEFELYPYVLSVMKYFKKPMDNQPTGGSYTHEVYMLGEPKQKTKKPWWKIW